MKLDKVRWAPGAGRTFRLVVTRQNIAYDSFPGQFGHDRARRVSEPAPNLVQPFGDAVRENSSHIPAIRAAPIILHERPHSG